DAAGIPYSHELRIGIAVSLYWLCYRHNSQISVVIEPGASLVHARLRASIADLGEGEFTEGQDRADFRFQRNGNRSSVSRNGRLGVWVAAAGFASGCDCENAVLWTGTPRTSRDLPAASTLVPARLGIAGALSMRHLCLWTFLLLTSLLPLSSLPAPT